MVLSRMSFKPLDCINVQPQVQTVQHFRLQHMSIYPHMYKYHQKFHTVRLRLSHTFPTTLN